MPGRKIILALDVGTTAIKVLAFEQETMACLGTASEPIEKMIQDDHVEQDPKMLVDVSIRLLKSLIGAHAIEPSNCIGLGITNQRETTILWNKKTREPIYPAIVWEDKRTQGWCDRQDQKFKDLIYQKTNLSLSPYFSASKIRWILDNVPEAKVLLLESNLAFGTVDTWLLWNLSKNKNHQTDWTNASRTLLFDVKKLEWSKELCDEFKIDVSILPEVKSSSSDFGVIRQDILGSEVQVMGICGDQQSSLFAASQYCGQDRGCTKITFGTGVFLMQIIDEGQAYDQMFYPALALQSDAHAIIKAIEYKIEGVGKEVELRLNDQKELDRYLDRLTDEVALVVSKLPIKPAEIIIDGGITQNQHLHAFLQEKVKSRVTQLPIYNGTALGVGYLVNKGVRSDNGLSLK